MADDNNQEIEAQGPGGLKIRARGTDVVIIVGSIIGGIMLYMVYEHRNEAKADNAALIAIQKEGNTQLAQVLREMNAVNKELVSVQRVTNCLISKDQGERRTALPECERIAR